MAGRAKAGQARYNRFDTNDIDYRTRAALSWDVRQQTEYGTLRTYIRIGVQVTTPTDTEPAGATFWDRAFMQFAGFTVGKTQSFFDLFTYGGGMSYHNVRTSGDTGAAGLTVWAYTAQFGNGFSGTLSLEAPQGHNRAPVVNGAGGRLLRQRRRRRRQRLRSANRDAERLPVPGHRRSTCGSIRRGVSSASAAPSTTPAAPTTARWPAPSTTAIPPTSSAGRPRLADSSTCDGGDQIGANFCYSEGAGGFCSNNTTYSLYNASTSVGLGWITDGVFDNGTSVEQTRVWSALAGYQHIWNPRWRTSLYGGYVNIEYGGAATQHHQLALRCGRCGGLRRGAGGGATITAFTPGLGQQLQSQLELLAGRYPDAVEPGAAARHRSRHTLLAHQHRLPGRGGGGGQQRTACDLPDRRPGHLVGVLPLAA